MQTEHKEVGKFLGAFAELRKATVSFFMTVRPSVRMEQLGCHWTDFYQICYTHIFRNFVENIQVLLKWNKNEEFQFQCFTVHFSIQ